MSIKEIAEKVSAAKSSIKELKKQKEKLKDDIKAFQRELIGEIDRLTVKALLDKGIEIQQYDVDGKIWYQLSLSDLASLTKGEHGWRRRMPSWRSTGIPVEILSPEDCPAFDKDYADRICYSTYDVDAMMLVDCFGYRIDTCHSYEGHKTVPHWSVDGFHKITPKSTIEAIKKYVKKVKEKDDIYIWD